MGYTPYVNIVLNNLTEDEALIEEQKLIEKYKPVYEGGILTNLSYSSGGKSNISPITRTKLSESSSGVSNGMHKFTEEQIRMCFDLIIDGYGNSDIERKTGVPHYVISDLKLGKKWVSIYNEYQDKLLNVKVQTSSIHNMSFEQRLEIIKEIDTRDKKTVLLKDIAKKYNLKDTYIVSINLKRQWKDIWKYYLDKKS